MREANLIPCEISGCTLKEELYNTASHAIGVLASIIGLIFLLRPFGDTLTTAEQNSYLIYGGSMVMLFMASTAYHGIRSKRWKLIFQMVDHCAIYVLIAGSYTPLLLITLDGELAETGLKIIWTAAGVGILFKLICGDKFTKLSLLSYLVMGWFAIFIINELWHKMPDEGFNLLITSGIIYSLGTIFYAVDKIPFNHAIWHLFVLGGASCHYFMVLFYLDPVIV